MLRVPYAPVSVTEAESKVRAVCTRAGLDALRLDSALCARMALLGELSATFEDNQRAMDLAEHVFEHSAQQGAAFTETEKTTVRVGSLLSDIGKTGPPNATPEQQRLIAGIFAIEGVSDERISVATLLRTQRAEDADAQLARFGALGLDPEMTVRQFWNLHTTWTLELLQHSMVPKEAVAAAAAHHLLEDVNPHSIVGEDGRFTAAFGSNLTFDRAEKLVILLDKYDAVRRRGRRDHVAAMAWLRAHVNKHPQFARDPEFLTLLDALDAALSEVAARLYA
jgi:hypothetical protein